MKLLLLASLIALCALAEGHKHTKDDQSPSGKQVSVTKEVEPNGEKNIEITVSGPHIPFKRIQVEGIPAEDTKVSQGEVLTQVFKDFQGDVSEGQYQGLLGRIGGAVGRGQISPRVLEVLQGLDQEESEDTLLARIVPNESWVNQGSQSVPNSPLVRSFNQQQQAEQIAQLRAVQRGVQQLKQQLVSKVQQLQVGQQGVSTNTPLTVQQLIGQPRGVGLYSNQPYYGYNTYQPGTYLNTVPRVY